MPLIYIYIIKIIDTHILYTYITYTHTHERERESEEKTEVIIQTFTLNITHALLVQVHVRYVKSKVKRSKVDFLHESHTSSQVRYI